MKDTSIEQYTVEKLAGTAVSKCVAVQQISGPHGVAIFDSGEQIGFTLAADAMHFPFAPGGIKELTYEEWKARKEQE